MDLFEKINRAFGGWYEGLFGGSEDVRPKDVLRKILVALEEHRKEGFDNKVYVPNQYVLEIAVDDEEEKEYLLSFLDRDDLEAAVRRYCQQNGYNVRGPLDFTIKEVEVGEEARRPEKVRVRCRYTPKAAAPEPTPAAPVPEVARADDDNPTVYEVGGSTDSDLGTVPAVAVARLAVRTPGKPPFDKPITRSTVLIGRSSHAGNDVVLAGDGMVSRRHARIEREADGGFTVYDLDTTNGTRVNGRKIDNRALKSGDEITIGETRITFHQDAPEEASAPASAPAGRSGHPSGPTGATVARLVLLEGDRVVDDFVLGSETVLGRGVTNDIVLPDRSVATRHARVRRDDPATIEALDGEAPTLLNGAALGMGQAAPLHGGDRITLGGLTLRYEEERR